MKSLPAAIRIEADALICFRERELRVPVKDLHELQPAGDSLELRTKDRKRIPIGIKAEEIPNFLEALFAAWLKADSSTARKAAFDYSSQERGILWLWFFLAFFFTGGMATVFLADAFNTLRCNYAFERGTKTALGEVHKVKKDRKGGIVWDMTYASDDGATHHGKRYALGSLIPENNYDKPATPPTVVYATDNTECWDLSLHAGEVAIPKAQRWFTLSLTMGFGWFFAILSVALAAFSIKKLRKRYPYRELIQKMIAI